MWHALLQLNDICRSGVFRFVLITPHVTKKENDMLIHRILGTPYVVIDLCEIESHDNLLPEGTKHYFNQCWLIIIWGYFHRKYSTYLYFICVWKLLTQTYSPPPPPTHTHTPPPPPQPPPTPGCGVGVWSTMVGGGGGWYGGGGGGSGLKVLCCIFPSHYY